MKGWIAGDFRLLSYIRSGHVMDLTSSSDYLRRGSNVAALRMSVEYVAPEALLPAARKLRRRSPRHLKRLARSIEDFGFLVPVLVDEAMGIVSGTWPGRGCQAARAIEHSHHSRRALD